MEMIYLSFIDFHYRSDLIIDFNLIELDCLYRYPLVEIDDLIIYLWNLM